MRPGAAGGVAGAAGAGGQARACGRRFERLLLVRVLVPFGVVGLLAATLTASGARPPTAGPVPVSAATLACPDLGLAGSQPLLLDVVRGAGPGGSVRPSHGPDVLRGDRHHDDLLFLPRSADPVIARLGDPGDGEPPDGPLLLAADGAAAAGLTATVTAPGSGAGPLRARCDPPRARTWFAGPATVAGRDPVVSWTNVGPRPARVSVGAVSSGPAAIRTEITVPPGRTVSRRLAALAPEATATALDVDVRAGRVLSWLTDRPSRSLPAAATPVPPTAGPAPRVLLGGVLTPVPGADGAGSPPAELVLAAPGAATTVRITLITSSGRHTPVGLEAVRVPAGTALRRRLALPPAAAVAVLAEATGGGEIVAGLAAGGGAAGPVWVGGVPPGADRTGRGGQAAGGTGSPGPSVPGVVVTAAPVPRDTAGALVLVATDRPATAWVDGARYEIPAGRAVPVPMRAGRAGGRVTAVGGHVAVSQVLGTAPPGAAGAAALRTVSAVVPIPGAPRFRHGPALLADPRAAR